MSTCESGDGTRLQMSFTWRDWASARLRLSASSVLPFRIGPRKCFRNRFLVLVLSRLPSDDTVIPIIEFIMIFPFSLSFFSMSSGINVQCLLGSSCRTLSSMAAETAKPFSLSSKNSGLRKNMSILVFSITSSNASVSCCPGRSMFPSTSTLSGV